MRNRLDRLTGRLWPILIILLLSALLVGPLWEAPGLPNSADGPLHLHRSAAVARAFAAGLFWPRWFPEVYSGLGAPVFHYYSPLFYMLTAAVHSAGLALDTAAKTVISIAFFLSGLAAYGWLRRLFGPLAAFTGALLFLAQPPIFREFYFQGDYPQLLAILLLPICLWALGGLARKSRSLDWLLAPLSLATLVLSHNLTAMIGAFFLAVYWVLLLLYTRNWAGFGRGVVAAVVAALLSALFWAPALGDVGMVQVQNLQQGFFHYQQYFLSWRELFSPIRPFDQRAANPPFPHAPGWPAWLAILAGSSVALYHCKAARRMQVAVRFWGLAGAALALFFLLLTLPVSAPLWGWIPGLSLLQFPARFLSLSALGAALAGAAAIAAVVPAWRGRVTGIVVLGVVVATAALLFPRHPFLRFATITPADTQRLEASDNLWGLTSGNEFLPRWADPANVARGPGLSPAAATLMWKTPHRAAIHVNGDDGAALVLPIHYFPAWEVRTDRGPAQSRPDAAGFLVVEGVSGVENLSLVWAGTDWQRRGQTASLVGVLVWLLLAAAAYVRRSATLGSQNDSTPGGLETPGRPIVVALLLALWLGRQALVTGGVDWFQPTSPPGQVASATHPLSATLGAPGASQVRLLGWDPLFRGEIRPGDSLGMRLYWQPAAPVAETLHSFLHLYAPQRKHSWAIVQNQNPGRIPTTSWLPDLYYVDELTLDLPLDQPPGNFTLVVGLVTEDGQRLPVSQGSDGLVPIGSVQIAPLRAGRSQPLRAETATPARVGDALHLQGYDLLPAPGGPILRTYWETTGTPPGNLRLYVHLLDPAGARLAQWDGPPLDGTTPAEGWQTGHLYIDRRSLWLPENLAPGGYTIRVGLYDPASGARLPFAPAPGAEGHFSPDALIIPFVVPE